MLIYGYFNSNLGDDLLIKNFIMEMNEQKYTFVYFDENEKKNIELMCERNNFKKNIVSYKLLKTQTDKNFFYVGGSTIRNAFSSVYFLFYFNRMYLRLLALKNNGFSIHYINTNLEKDTFTYRIFLNYFMGVIDNIAVRDYSSYILASKYVKNTYLIKDLVDQKLEPNTENYCCVNVIPTYLDNANYCKIIEEFIQKNSCKIYFVEFQKDEYKDNKFKAFLENISLIHKNIEVVMFQDCETTTTTIKNAKSTLATRFHMYMLSKNAGNLDTAIVYDHKILQYEETFFSNTNLLTIDGDKIDITKVKVAPTTQKLDSIFRFTTKK